MRLRWYDYLNINLFWLGLNIRNNALGAIFMPYLVDAFARPEIKNTSLSLMRTAGLIIAMLVSRRTSRTVHCRGSSQTWCPRRSAGWLRASRPSWSCCRSS